MSALLSDDDLYTFVESGVRAPSSHNTQPWQFSIRADAIDVFADRTLALAVSDPDDRELTISCGAALFNLRVAAANAGHATSVDILPNHGDEDLLATLRLIAGSPDESIGALFEQIPKRHTYRKEFVAEEVGEETQEALTAAAGEEGATLHFLEGGVRRDTAALIAEGDRMLFADRRSRRQGDGLTVRIVALPVTRLVVSSFNLGNSAAAKDHELADDSPLLAVLTTSGDSVVDWLTAGQALQRTLLTMAGRTWHASYLNQPCQVSELRPRLQALIPGSEFPQLVMRLGRPADPGEPSPRRSVSEVLV